MDVAVCWIVLGLAIVGSVSWNAWNDNRPLNKRRRLELHLVRNKQEAAHLEEQIAELQKRELQGQSQE